jgi:hypothetical protein
VDWFFTALLVIFVLATAASAVLGAHRLYRGQS